MTAVEVSNGLVLPYAMMTIGGKGAAAAVVLVVSPLDASVCNICHTADSRWSTLQVFMAVTSVFSSADIHGTSLLELKRLLFIGATSAQLIAVSSIVSFDIYKVRSHVASYSRCVCVLTLNRAIGIRKH
jgi:hypothetical protein